MQPFHARVHAHMHHAHKFCHLHTHARTHLWHARGRGGDAACGCGRLPAARACVQLTHAPWDVHKRCMRRQAWPHDEHRRCSRLAHSHVLVGPPLHVSLPDPPFPPSRLARPSQALLPVAEPERQPQCMRGGMHAGLPGHHDDVGGCTGGPKALARGRGRRAPRAPRVHFGSCSRLGGLLMLMMAGAMGEGSARPLLYQQWWAGWR